MSQTHPISSYSIKSYAQVSRSTQYDYLEISCTPANEPCTQVGTDSTSENKLECNVYIDQLIRKYGEPPAGCSYFIMKNDHEKGIYYEAAILFHDNEAAVEYAFKVEEGCDNWDDISKEQLKGANYSLFSDNSGGKPRSHLRRA